MKRLLEIFSWSSNKLPELKLEAKKIINEYILKNYPFSALDGNISGEVVLKYNCSKKGLPVDIEIIEERSQGFGFGKVAVKAFKSPK